MDAHELFERLLHAEVEDEVDAILARHGFDLQNESVWRPLGDMENNFSTVGNQQTEATAALVEKIINGIDAELMAECFRAGIDPEGSDAPKTMAQAVQRFFGVRDGLLGRISREFMRTMNILKKMFPDIKQTRFHNSAEFYTLFLLIWEMDRDKFVLTEKRRSRLAFALLRNLSTGVDELRIQLRKATPARPAQKLYSDYLLTVQGDTDSSANRERRRELLRNLIASLFQRKDEKRIFTSEQRRILWNRDDKKGCSRCNKPLTWDKATIDHVLAYSKGGKTTLGNARLMCRSCNSRKGAG